MRLIDTTTLELKEFFDDRIPPYAILSHRWGPDEVTYEEYIAGNNHNGAGYQKILDLCRLARNDTKTSRFKEFSTYSSLESYKRPFIQFQWAWIDTICIDKRSSAELSEAINSMYKWYQRAVVCLVFLPDVTALSTSDLAKMNGTDTITIDGHAAFRREDLTSSIWFTRGWTAQELVAPKFVLFLDTQLNSLGWKHDDFLLSALSEASRIVDDVLGWEREASDCCIAQRISWVSHRTTARAEDMAYCLMGLCGVNMPLLYGEGLSNAFRRLQLEVIASSTDDSIFAFESFRGGMLASNPEDFYMCSTMSRGYALSTSPTLLTRTQRGIEFDVQIPRGLRPDNRMCWYAPLILSSLSTTKKVFYVSICIRELASATYKDGSIKARRVDMRTFEDSVGDLPREIWRTELRRPEFDFSEPGRASCVSHARRLAQSVRRAKTVRLCVPLT